MDDLVFKELDKSTGTKNKLVDLIGDLAENDLYGKSENVVYGETKKEEGSSEEIKCLACMKSFTSSGSLKRHHERNPTCVNWLSISKESNVQITKGIHLLVDELLEKAISKNNELECKYCNVKFTNKGNHHKHFNFATVCNRLALMEFKTLVDNL